MLKENEPILKEVNVDAWHEKGYTGKGVTVALFDSHCMPRTHMKSYHIDALGTEKQVGHGTNVGFTVHEFAPDAKIYALNHSFHSDKAYEWIKAHKDEIDLINVSLAGIAGALTPQFERYKALGIPFICASGNDGYDDRISYPAGYDWTIGIGAWWWSYNAYGKKGTVATYSNGGADLDAVSPSGIYMLNDDGSTFSVSGTSFASPSAVGMLACYVQWRKESGLPKLNPEEARKFIRDNALDVEEKGFDYGSGYGLFVMPEVPKIEPKPIEPAKVAPTPAKVAKTNGTKPLIYKVRSGNSVSGLSKKYGASKADLRKWNALQADDLQVGRYIFLVDPAEVVKVLED